MCVGESIKWNNYSTTSLSHYASSFGEQPQPGYLNFARFANKFPIFRDFLLISDGDGKTILISSQIFSNEQELLR
jgi:hypothetical protein